MKLNTQQEQEAVRKLKRGDTQAFTRLFYAYENRLFGYSASLLPDKKDAEEIVQEVFYQLWKNRERLDENKNFKSLLFTITKRIVYKQIRKRARQLVYQQEQAEEMEVSWSATEDLYQYHELETNIHKIVESMSLKRKQVFMMSRFQGMNNHEIASQLNISLSTVENHINKALRILKKELSRYDSQLLLFLLLLSNSN